MLRSFPTQNKLLRDRSSNSNCIQSWTLQRETKSSSNTGMPSSMTTSITRLLSSTNTINPNIKTMTTNTMIILEPKMIHFLPTEMTIPIIKGLAPCWKRRRGYSILPTNGGTVLTTRKASAERAGLPRTTTKMRCPTCSSSKKPACLSAIWSPRRSYQQQETSKIRGSTLK